jgi:hypothetical protein
MKSGQTTEPRWLGYCVEARERGGGAKFKIVSPVYAARSAAEDYAVLWRAQFPNRKFTLLRK